ncbi:hypothetical protein vseg_020914 [Gypsophila vaccaria]
MPKLVSHSVPEATALPTSFTMLNIPTANFEVETSFINLVERNQFGGGATKDSTKHMRIFIDYWSTIIQTELTQDQFRVMLFCFSLREAARDWITEAWARFKSLAHECSHHGFAD